MSHIHINPAASFEVALKRFNRKVQEAGILAESRRRYYESPQMRRKRMAEAQRRPRRRSR